ncbi:hypothetical protein F4678DRAFT_34186 [Xylaria arbuscula]|nr:hypothetical protein F4678DRAFT_34186 [Xylaria arbuscula]
MSTSIASPVKSMCFLCDLAASIPSQHWLRIVDLYYNSSLQRSYDTLCAELREKLSQTPFMASREHGKRGARRLWNVYSLRILREPKFVLKMAFGFALLMPLTYSWHSLKGSDTPFYLVNVAYSNSSADSKWKSSSDLTKNTTRSIPISPTDGLRIVVFGGGDAATPVLSASEWSDQAYAWTEIMCQKLRCDTYLNFVPGTSGTDGAVMSNQFLDAAYKRVSRPSIRSNRDDNTSQLDYSWVTKQYPKPYQPDLAAQVDSFLSSAQSQRPSTESLWVFNVGYWDIWYLAALPRKLAIEVLDSKVRDLFFQVERLYQATRDQEPVTFPRVNSDLNTSSPTETSQPRVNDTKRVSFRLFLTRLFDISLTPGFASARPSPPEGHSRTTQLRNAAFLTKYWNTLLDVAASDWLATSDPEDWSKTDRIDIQVVEALMGKRPLAKGGETKKEKKPKDQHSQATRERGDGTSLPRRRLVSYGVGGYLREMIVDGQLRNADLSDHNGLGARPPEDGFLEIAIPCVLKVAGDGVDGAAGIRERISVCKDPDNYLFFTEFTVSPRAIREIGVRAARKFLDQVEASSAWSERARMHTESERGQAQHRMTEPGA